ncbi:MAG: hypothetical protein LRS43_03300 [Desulfurococcales archaeon]|nr:hypothetical protein [Desulfurococcales archaeon]
MGAQLVVRELSGPEELEEAVEVQRKAWGMSDYRDAVPSHLLRALSANGGLVLGAFVGGKLVGVSYGWIVAGKEVFFYSHATGVAEEEKYKGVGFRLKLAQREWALSRGIRLAKWTFDPLQSLNSYFNLVKLGAVAREYYVNYYGEMRDSINVGLGTDRVKAEWWLDSRRVHERISSKRIAPTVEDMERMGAHVAVRPEKGYSPSRPRIDASARIVLVGLPENISRVRELSREKAVKWRLATREVYGFYMQRGYILVDNIEDREGNRYNVLWRTSLDRVLSGSNPWDEPTRR